VEDNWKQRFARPPIFARRKNKRKWDLRAVFYVERDRVVTVTIGTHDLQKG
jgi:hypothetical protein